MLIPHDFPFDPTYGYSPEDLLNVTPPTDEPSHFRTFWESTYAEASGVRPLPQTRAVASPQSDYDCWEITFDAWGARRIGGWLLRPTNQPAAVGVVMGHGYGGRSEPAAVPSFGQPAAILQVCKRGFHQSAFPDLPDTANAHVLHGIESRETYLHRGCVADVWAAASALLALEPQIGDRLGYWGGSFGGGIGAMALPWDRRFSRAFLDIPSFGHHPLRLTLPCYGSGEAVRQRHESHPEIVDVLRYFDAALHARHITCPTMVAAACFDPAVPPPGQFAVYHALRCERELFVRQYAHFELPLPRPGNEPWPTAARWLADGWNAPTSGLA